MIIKVDRDSFIEVHTDTKSSTWIDKPTIVANLADAKARVSEVKPPTDKELLAWAKANYPFVDNSVEQVYVKQVIETNEALLEQIKTVEDTKPTGVSDVGIDNKS
jgi:hypothetical protein